MDDTREFNAESYLMKAIEIHGVDKLEERGRYEEDLQSWAEEIYNSRATRNLLRRFGKIL
jgi:hypothetical protein